MFSFAGASSFVVRAPVSLPLEGKVPSAARQMRWRPLRVRLRFYDTALFRQLSTSSVASRQLPLKGKPLVRAPVSLPLKGKPFAQTYAAKCLRTRPQTAGSRPHWNTAAQKTPFPVTQRPSFGRLQAPPLQSAASRQARSQGDALRSKNLQYTVRSFSAAVPWQEAFSENHTKAGVPLLSYSFATPGHFLSASGYICGSFFTRPG